MGSSGRSRWIYAMGALVGSVSLCACALVLGIEPPEPMDVTVSEGGDGPDGASDGGSGQDAPLDDYDAGTPCRGVVPTDAEKDLGVFVSWKIGADNDECGSPSVPCRTISYGLVRAQVLGKDNVYVARQRYEEQVVLGTSALGRTIEGGWELLSPAPGVFDWSRTCDPSAVSIVRIRPNDAPRTIEAVDLDGSVTFKTLTIESKDAAPGESVYGIFARGATTVVVLHGVAVEPGPGGQGGTGATGAIGAIGNTGCPAGSGQGAVTPGAIGRGADAGLLTADGFIHIVGGAGDPGQTGSNGTSPDGGCVPCFTCPNLAVCGKNAAGQSCGGPGVPGCGGGPGQGGAPGIGGGSSFAIYAWGASIIVDGGRVVASNGGGGGLGGIGGPGGAGGPGATGTPGTTCISDCNAVIPCNGPPHAGPGGAGGNGGAGSQGGTGGGGAGGHSIAIFAGADASVSVVEAGAAVIAHGDAGVGASNGAPGLAKDRHP